MNATTVNLEHLEQKYTALTGGLHLRVFYNLKEVENIWIGLEASGTGTLYQTFAWCNTWVDQFAKSKNVTPCIIVAENAFGTVEFLLPLQMRRSKGVVFMEMLTAPNYGYASALYNLNFLQHKAVSWFSTYSDQLTAALPNHDVFHLHDTPSLVLGHPNPLLQMQHFRGANQSHVLALQDNFQDLFVRRRSHESRRTIRKRDAKLEALPNLLFDSPTEDQTRIETLATMFNQQEVRMAEFGVHNIFSPAERQFYAALIQTKSSLTTEFRTYCLTLDGKILAVLMGAKFNGVFWALISSMDETSHKKYSPGDYLLRQIIKSLCQENMSALDFSAGDTAYKHHWSDYQIELNLIVSASSFKGLLFAFSILIKEKLKRFAKQTPIVSQAMFKARKLLRGRRLSV